jgi:hypothetical protein
MSKETLINNFSVQIMKNLKLLGFQGGLRAISAISAAIQTQTFHQVTNSTTLQALYKITDLELEFTSLLIEIQPHFLIKHMQKIVKMDLQCNPFEKLIVVLTALFSTRFPKDNATYSPENNIHLCNTCLTKLHDQTVDPNIMTNFIWKLLNQLSGWDLAPRFLSLAVIASLYLLKY